MDLAATFAELAQDAGDGEGDGGEDAEEADEHEPGNELSEGLQVIDLRSVGCCFNDGQDEPGGPAHEGHGEHGSQSLRPIRWGRL